MADFGSPIAQNVNPLGQGLQTLSTLMNVKRAQLGLQSQAAQVQQEQQTAQQRSGIANFMSSFDPTKHVGSDGTLDLDEVLTDPKLRQAAGDQFPALMQQLVQVKQSQLGAKQQLANLNGTLRDQFSSTVGSLRTDPDVVADNAKGRAKVQQAMGDYAESGGSDAARVANIYSQVINHTPQGKLTQVLSNFQLQAMDAATQAGKQAPVLTDTGAQQVNVNPQAAGGNLSGTPDLTRTLSPTEKLPYVRARGAAGAEGAQGATNDETLYNNIVQTGTKATQIKSLSQDVQGLAREVQTGQYSKAFADKWAALAQTFGLPPGAMDAATRRQLLSKAAARLKVQSEAGASTDAERAGVDAAMPDPEHMTPTAVQEAARYVGAQADVNSARMDLANKHRQINGGASTGLRDTDSQFMKAADPRVFEYQGIPAGKQRQDYLRQHFTNPDDLKAFLAKADALRSYGAIK